MIQVNLIPAARRAKQQARRRKTVWIKALRAYSLLLAALCALAFLPARADAPSLESALARVDRRIQNKTKELDAVRAQSTAISKQLDLARAIGQHPDWSALMAAIARARTDLALLESLDLSIVKEEKKDKPATAPAPKGAKPAIRETVLIKLTGIAVSPAACVQFAGALERLSVFERVVIKDTRVQLFGRMNATRFEIEAFLSATPVPSAPVPPGAAP